MVNCKIKLNICSIALRNLTKHKRGRHLGAEERGAIQSLKKQGVSNQAIARIIDCSPSTVGYELQRGTPEYSGRGCKLDYSTKCGAAVYKVNRSRCRRPKTVPRDSRFMCWMVKMSGKRRWSFDTCVGQARRMRCFTDKEFPCTKTLYSLLKASIIDALFRTLLPFQCPAKYQ